MLVLSLASVSQSASSHRDVHSHSDGAAATDMERPKPPPDNLVPPLVHEGILVANPDNELAVAIEVHTDSIAHDIRRQDFAEGDGTLSHRATEAVAAGRQEMKAATPGT